MSYMSSVVERVERLALPMPKGLHKFLAVGMVGLIVHTGIYTALEMLGVQKSVSWLCGLLIATTVTWTLNRRLTFTASGRKIHHEALRYIIVTMVSQSVSFLVFHTLVELAKFVPSPVDVVFGSAVATIFSYIGNRFFTFAPQPEPKAQTAPK